MRRSLEYKRRSGLEDISEVFRTVAMEKKELEPYAFEVLEKAGIERGQIVLDFGCGSGTYTIPAARIVGSEGKVYALDKDKKALDELMQRAESVSLGNIERMNTCGGPEIELTDQSIDVVLLFDVFHSYYFPRANERRKLLGEVYRILRPDGFLLVYPKHMESEAKGEIESANFYLASEYSGPLIHDNQDLENGPVLNFKKRKCGF